MWAVNVLRSVRARAGHDSMAGMKADFLIAGGGIVGLTIACALLVRDPKARVVVLEKEDVLGRHASGRNSGVLHSGIYYPADTMKARACASGARRLAAYCHEHKLPISHVGKLVVATSAAESEALETYRQRADALGVRAEWVEPARIHDIEPAAATGFAALHLPDVAVIDARRVLTQLADDITGLGGRIRLGCRVTGVDAAASVLHTSQGDMPFGQLINATGAHVDRLAAAYGLAERYVLMPFMGRYFRLAGDSGLEVRGLIYPVPDARLPFLGIHFTRSVHGDVHVGPSAVPVLGREHYSLYRGIDWRELPGRLQLLAGLYAKNRQGFRLLAHREIRCLGRAHFAAEAARLVPGLKPAHLQPCGKAGIRPQLFDRQKGEMVMDFLLETRGNALHVLNAISPALTCSFSIADHVVERITG